MKTLDEIVTKLGAKDIKDMAFEKTNELTKEFKNIVKNIKKIDLNSINSHPAIEQIKENVTGAINRVQDMEIVEFAKNTVESTKNQVFSVLNIPSQEEVDNLTRKLVSLEKKFKAVQRHIQK
ncbi:MAG: hypothetical protein HQM16_01425 [Deltaproteobacteria bacterium]|nr:hypothetical protein [Deltaproteobacteria bacterium]